MEKFHIILAEAVAQLTKETQRQFTVMLKHGSMSIEYFSPQKIDTRHYSHKTKAQLEVALTIFKPKQLIEVR